MRVPGPYGFRAGKEIGLVGGKAKESAPVRLRAAWGKAARRYLHRNGS